MDWLATKYTRTDWQQGTQGLTGNKIHKAWLATMYTRTDWQQGTQGLTGNNVHKDWLATMYTRTDWQQGQGTQGPANYSSRRTDWQQHIIQGPVTVCPDSLVWQKNVTIACWICGRVYPHARAALTAVMSRLGDPGSTPPLLSTPPVTPQTQYWQLPWIQSDWQNSVLAPSPPHLHCCSHHVSHHKHSTDSYHGYRWTELWPGSLPSPHSCSHHVSHHTVLTVTMGTEWWTELWPGSTPTTPPLLSTPPVTPQTQYWQLPWIQSDWQNSVLAPSPPHLHCCSHHVSHHKHSTDSYHGYKVMNRALTWLPPLLPLLFTPCVTPQTQYWQLPWVQSDEQSSVLAPPPPHPHCYPHHLSHHKHIDSYHGYRVTDRAVSCLTGEGGFLVLLPLLPTPLLLTQPVTWHTHN